MTSGSALILGAATTGSQPGLICRLLTGRCWCFIDVVLIAVGLKVGEARERCRSWRAEEGRHTSRRIPMAGRARNLRLGA